MSFGRHRTQPGLNGNGLQKKEDFRIKSDELNEDAIIILQETEEKKRPVKKRHQAIKKKPGEPVISNDIEKEEINLLKNKYIDNTGVTGQNTIVREFRAICKKKGLLINETLNKMLHDWNTANYNL